MRSRGRPSAITLAVDKHSLRVADGKIKQLFKSKVRKFKSSSGGYIPISQEFEDHDVFIIILNK
jgi:hypothetical protein